jgi:hypothetical protein
MVMIEDAKLTAHHPLVNRALPELKLSLHEMPGPLLRLFTFPPAFCQFIHHIIAFGFLPR